MNQFDDLKAACEPLARTGIERALQGDDEGDRRKASSRSDAVFYAIRDAVRNTMPSDVDIEWCLSMLEARPSILDARVNASASSLRRVIRTAVEEMVVDELEKDLMDFSRSLKVDDVGQDRPRP